MPFDFVLEVFAHVAREAAKIDADLLVLGFGRVQVRNELHRTVRRMISGRCLSLRSLEVLRRGAHAFGGFFR